MILNINKMVTVDVLRYENISNYSSFQKFAELIDKVCSAIPADFLAGAMVSIESEYDCSSVEMSVSYERPMTYAEQEEEFKRIAQESAERAIREQRDAGVREAFERNMLAILKKKYE